MRVVRLSQCIFYSLTGDDINIKRVSKNFKDCQKLSRPFLTASEDFLKVFKRLQFKLCENVFNNFQTFPKLLNISTVFPNVCGFCL